MHPASSLVPPPSDQTGALFSAGLHHRHSHAAGQRTLGGVMGAGGPGAGTEGLFEEGITSCPWLSGQLT